MSAKNQAVLLNTIVNLSAALARVSAVVAKAHAEGREGPSDEEMLQFENEDDAGRAQLVASIEAAKAASPTR